MRKKSGITLMMLVIYILVVIILAGSITLSFFKSTQIGNTNEKTFKAKIKDYMNEFEVNKNYNLINGVDITTLSIEDLIPSITINDKQFLKLSDDASKLIFYNMPSSDKRYEYLTELGLSN